MFADNTDNFFVMNDRELGAKEVDIVLIKKGDGYTADGNTMVVESPSKKGVVLLRMLITDESRLGALIKMQKQASCRSLDFGAKP
ncbi:MAG: DUF1254 domain-containing protein, partial [Deltaproteobacteria bacterium]|nr:DUF1254 domain-containing protein [Deltaproteobacteria bacterium]